MGSSVVVGSGPCKGKRSPLTEQAFNEAVGAKCGQSGIQGPVWMVRRKL